MRRLTVPLLVLLAAAVTAAFAFAPAQNHVYRLVDASFFSPSLRDTLHLAIYVPPDYDASTTRYPVVYFLHGLPGSSVSYRGAGYVADALAKLPRDAILVAPQGATDSDSDAEYLDWGPGRNWETALAREVPAYIDEHFRTIQARHGRALIGVSAGGYGASIIALHHLGSFSVVEAWSGYFHPTDPSGTQALSRGARESAHNAVDSLEAAFQRRPTFFGFYVGREDTRFRAENVVLHQELRAARVPHSFALYPGGHTQSLWSAHAGAWLGLALDRLAPPQ